MAPEAMFNPGLLDIEAPGIAEMAFNCINVRQAATAVSCPHSRPAWRGLLLLIHLQLYCPSMGPACLPCSLLLPT